MLSDLILGSIKLSLLATRNGSQHMQRMPNLASKIILPLIAMAAIACDPVLASLSDWPTATLRPPIVRYVTSTDTPTVTLTSTGTQTATQTFTPTITATNTTTATFTPTLTQTPSATPTMFPTRVAGATLTPMPTFAPRAYLHEQHFWMGRPVPDGYQDFVEPNYRYGTTQGGALRPHHGVDFDNPVNTPVIAAAGGQVVFAGTDQETELGIGVGFYGKAVVVKLYQSYYYQPIYTLYGHLDTTLVSVGQLVAQGDVLGTVGGTGVAKGGAHLHMEIRVGYNDYLATRNPELWLKPFPGWGAIAGRVTDSDNHLVPLANITIRSISLDDEDRAPVQRYTTTYVHETLNPDEVLGENFAVTDLPAGTYEVWAGNGYSTVKKTVRTRPGQLSWVEFRDVILPSTWTPTPTTTP